MDTQKVVGIGVLLVLVVLLIWFGFVNRQETGTQDATNPEFTEMPAGIQIPTITKTRAPVPQDAKVPEVNEKNVPADVAVPQTVVAAGPNTQSKFRAFVMSVTGDTFMPNTILVREGDTVHIAITATDKNYDFTQPDYGLAASLPKGALKVVEFGALLTGKFQFYCSKCGGPDKGPVGYVTVVK